MCKQWVKLVDQAIADLDAYIVGWIHDEVQIASKSGTEDDVGNRLQRMAEEAGKSLSITIPITADYVVGNDWSETTNSNGFHELELTGRKTSKHWLLSLSF